MAEALNRSEVESLLTALNPGRKSSRESHSAESVQHSTSVSSSQQAKQVVSVFEAFRHHFASISEQCLQQATRIKRYMPQRLPCSEVLERGTEENLVFVIESEQSGGDLIVILARDFARRLVTRMVGQQPADGDSGENSLSKIETRLLLRWLRESFTGVLAPSQWRFVDADVVSVEELEAYHLQSPWWCEHWELKADDLRGRILIAGQWEYFSALVSMTHPSLDEAVEQEERVRETVPETLEIEAVWGEISAQLDSVEQLEMGMVLPAAKDSEGRVSLELSGRRLAFGTVGELDRQKAVKISESTVGE